MYFSDWFLYVVALISIVIFIYCIILIALNVPKLLRCYKLSDKTLIDKFSDAQFVDGEILNQHGVKIGFYSLNEIYTSETLYLYRDNHKKLFDKYVGKVV